MCPAEDPMSELVASEQPTVLVVEDEVLVRLAIAEHLRECGFTVAEAANGEEAQALILAGLEVDLVFSDINMPGAVDGITLASWLKDHGIDAPVVLTSGERAMLEAAQSACANVRVFITKPYPEVKIVEHFRALLASRA
jgi:CheY-like chemotaxis protein